MSYTIEDIELMPSEISELINKTPNLRNVFFSLRFEIRSNVGLRIVPKIVKLKIYYSRRSEMLIKILSILRSLVQLKLNLSADCIDGHQWKQIIRQYHPNLKILEFIMLYKFSNDINKDHQIDRLLDTFRSDFWVFECRCFVRCDWNDDQMIGQISTLPFSFQRFSFSFPCSSKRSSLDENKQDSYNCVNSLEYRSDASQSFTLSKIEFNKIRNLSIKFPVDDHFWSIISTFNSVNHLVLILNNDIKNCRIQFENLVNEMVDL